MHSEEFGRLDHAEAVGHCTNAFEFFGRVRLRKRIVNDLAGETSVAKSFRELRTVDPSSGGTRWHIRHVTMK